MYLGRIVETGLGGGGAAAARAIPIRERCCRRCRRSMRQRKREIIRLQGELPSPVNPPSGCHFHPRCPEAMPLCRERYPEQTRTSATHEVRCHLYGK